MKRRDFITLVGGAAAWPLAARAQQPGQMRRVGMLFGIADDPTAQAEYAAFLQGLQQLGWTEGRNVHIDRRWAEGNAAALRKYAAELVALAPDVILSVGSASMGPLLEATRTVPIVFVITPDPVGAGYVDSLSRPGGNATGFMMFEYSLCAKWPELLKEIAPGVTRAAVLRDSAITAGKREQWHQVDWQMRSGEMGFESEQIVGARRLRRRPVHLVGRRDGLCKSVGVEIEVMIADSGRIISRHR